MGGRGAGVKAEGGREALEGWGGMEATEANGEEEEEEGEEEEDM